MSSNVQLDPFVAQAQNDNVAPLQKIEGIVLLPLGEAYYAKYHPSW